ncbi:hypothetical protein RGAI101_2755 [Roseobacter sp. GAI101]|nr:hypothetical protein RGAI101_2755 [Roseobacter sp. GAI101]
MPAVKRAAQSIVLKSAKAQVSPTMRTVPSDQAKFTVVIPKQHQPLTSQRHGDHRSGNVQLGAFGHNNPTGRVFKLVEWCFVISLGHAT